MKRFSVFLFLIFLIACGGGGGGPTAPSSVPQTMPYDNITQWLITYNSRGTGHSIRYPELPIKIQCYEGVDVDAVVKAANEWTRATAGAVKFALTYSNDANIYIGLDDRIYSYQAIGMTSQYRINYTTGVMEVCVIRLPDLRRYFSYSDANVVFYLITLHELGHAIGIFGHPHEGDIMDDRSLEKAILTRNFRYLQISSTTASAINRLYSYPPGTLYSMALVSKEPLARLRSGYDLIEDYFSIR